MIRQKTYEIFIRPYLKYKDNILIYKEKLYISTRDLNGVSGGGFGEYTIAQGGECWMLHKENIMSLQEAQQEVKKLMDTLGYPKDAIKLREAIPLDYVITPSK